MFKKILISIICIGVIASTLFLCFAGMYFVIPSKKSAAEIQLAKQVTDPESDDTTESTDTTEQTEDNSNIYVADVYQSLTLRSKPDSNSDPLSEDGIEPLTQLEVQQFVSDNKFAYVKVLDGKCKDMYGYVNSEYITKLGEPTVRAVSQTTEEEY